MDDVNITRKSTWRGRGDVFVLNFAIAIVIAIVIIILSGSMGNYGGCGMFPFAPGGFRTVVDKMI